MVDVQEKPDKGYENIVSFTYWVDYDQDNDVSVKDATAIQKIVAGLLSDA